MLYVNSWHMLSIWKQYSPAAEKMQRLRGCVLNLFTNYLWQHRTIPALRLKHRSGSCGTASALPKCSIMPGCGTRIVLRGQKPLALCDRCPCFGSLFPPLAALTFAASSIICAFGLAASAPRSPYRHLELCGIALAFEQCIYFSACFSSYKKFSASMGVRVSISRLFSLSTTSLGTAGLL